MMTKLAPANNVLIIVNFVLEQKNKHVFISNALLLIHYPSDSLIFLLLNSLIHKLT